MQNQKLYTIELTAQEVLLTSAILGNTSASEALKDLSDYEEITKSDLAGLYPLLLETKNPDSTDKTLSGKLLDLYEKFYYKALQEVHEDFKPKTVKLYFCIYKNYNCLAATSGFYQSREEMLKVLGDSKYEMIQEFSAEVPKNLW